MSTGQILQRVSQRLKLGSTIAEALESVGEDTLIPAAKRGDKLSQIFESAEPHIVRALTNIEDGVDVASGLARLAEVELETESLRAKVDAALVYPRIILVMGLVIGVFFLSMVAQPLRTFYTQVGVDLNGFTESILSKTELMSHPLVLLTVVVAILALARVNLQHPFFDKLAIHLPLIGNWYRRRDAVSYFLWLDLGLEQGLPLPQASRQAANVCRCSVLRKMMLEMSEKLTTGDSLSQALESCSYLPKGTQALVALAEGKELKDGALAKVAQFLERSLISSVQRGLILLEPTAVAVLATIVATVVVLVTHPMVQLVKELG